ncbi:hypothetical protein EVAR_91718_1 [Eumeta japonica]|uniref:Uncharacterized protein n=1 Tax=Eumeta variegata TaxID=151549 RepID=A0A4C1ZAP4_EUMVA|nr:hypothetical protein EVAR_91718_1 [Eumeta japonica]
MDVEWIPSSFVSTDISISVSLSHSIMVTQFLITESESKECRDGPILVFVPFSILDTDPGPVFKELRTGKLFPASRAEAPCSASNFDSGTNQSTCIDEAGSRS